MTNTTKDTCPHDTAEKRTVDANEKLTKGLKCQQEEK